MLMMALKMHGKNIKGYKCHGCGSDFHFLCDSLKTGTYNYSGSGDRGGNESSGFNKVVNPKDSEKESGDWNGSVLLPQILTPLLL